MTVMEAIRHRFSVRQFKPYEVEEEKLERVLEAARLAPSARNLQEWRFVVVREPEMRAALAEAANGQRFVAEAPVVIVACAITSEHVMSCGLHCFPIDVAIAMAYMTLVAVEEELGTCWIGAFNADRVKDLLGIPADVIVVGLLPIGYPAGEPPRKKRLSLAEIVMHERWGR
ncbi:MAG: nitroreductase family protein [Armatimonadota bacterium]